MRKIAATREDVHPVPAVSFQTSTTTVALRPAPIEPSWVREGAPVARATEISRSADGTAFTVIWDCTAGTFDWIYGCDETVHILEGSVVLQDGGNPPTRLGPGDVVFFPKGSRALWTVDSYVKKIAFFRKSLPNPLSGPYKLLRRLKHRLLGRRAPAPVNVIGQSA